MIKYDIKSKTMIITRNLMIILSQYSLVSDKQRVQIISGMVGKSFGKLTGKRQEGAIN